MIEHLISFLGGIAKTVVCAKRRNEMGYFTHLLQKLWRGNPEILIRAGYTNLKVEGGQNVSWLRTPHQGWGQRARKFLKNWSLRLVKTHSKFNNCFPIILTRLKIKASNTKKIDELIGNIFHFKGVNQRTMYQNKAKTYPD